MAQSGFLYSFCILAILFGTFFWQWLLLMWSHGLKPYNPSRCTLWKKRLKLDFRLWATETSKCFVLRWMILRGRLQRQNTLQVSWHFSLCFSSFSWSAKMAWFLLPFWKRLGLLIERKNASIEWPQMHGFVFPRAWLTCFLPLGVEIRTRSREVHLGWHHEVGLVRQFFVVENTTIGWQVESFQGGSQLVGNMSQEAFRLWRRKIVSLLNVLEIEPKGTSPILPVDKNLKDDRSEKTWGQIVLWSPPNKHGNNLPNAAVAVNFEEAGAYKTRFFTICFFMCVFRIFSGGLHIASSRPRRLFGFSGGACMFCSSSCMCSSSSCISNISSSCKKENLLCCRLSWKAREEKAEDSISRRPMRWEVVEARLSKRPFARLLGQGCGKRFEHDPQVLRLPHLPQDRQE